MKFNQNLLINNENIINTMESIMDNQFHFVYLDLPWFTNNKMFSYSFKREDTESNKDGGPKEERLIRAIEKEKKEQFDYGVYISKILENSMRILCDTGILVFRSPAHSVIDYKLILDQVFSNTYIMQITLELTNRRSVNQNPEAMNHEISYIYSKTDQYNLNAIYEDFDSYSNEFMYYDDRDKYNLTSLTTINGLYSYCWKGVSPKGNQKWRYYKDKMDKLLEEHRIVIKNNQVYLKNYMKEHPRKKSSVWKANWGNFFDIQEKPSVTMKAKHFIDLLNMVTNENDWIFSPYDIDQKLPVIAQNLNRKWVTINPTLGHDYNYKEFLNTGSFVEVTSIQGNTKKIAYKDFLKNVDDIKNLKERLSKLNTDISNIKSQLGLDDVDEEIVVEKILKKIDDLIEKSDIESYIPIVQKWVQPFWERLEDESKRFLPTAELLYQEYKDLEQFDLSTAMIAYCKALEKEIYTKMFKGYIKKLIKDGINIENTFPEDFYSNETKRFAEAVKIFTTKHKNTETEWRFELGTMVYILNKVLDNEKSPLLKDGRIYKDFKKYLEEHFEYGFFDVGFLLDLINLAELRNDSAHPQIVTPDRIKQGKELTKKKLIELLQYYKI
jgi:hypothetical protein